MHVRTMITSVLPTVASAWSEHPCLLLLTPCKGQGLAQTVSTSHAKNVRCSLLRKQLYLTACMSPKPKPQRVSSQKSDGFRASTVLTYQSHKASKYCACHVELMSLLLPACSGAREQHGGALLNINHAKRHECIPKVTMQSGLLRSTST